MNVQVLTWLAPINRSVADPPTNDSTANLRWHRELVARKWDYSQNRRKVGRPATPQEIVELILKFAKENPSWGHNRIADMLANIGHQVSDRTVGRVLKPMASSRHRSVNGPRRGRPS